MRITFDGLNGYIYRDDRGQIWWVPNSTRKPELLQNADSLCGVGMFETGECDPLRDCCTWHDQAYINRRRYEELGFNRYLIDQHFLSLMLVEVYKLQRIDPAAAKALWYRAQLYYDLVRMFGWICYYRHEPADNRPLD